MHHTLRHARGARERFAHPPEKSDLHRSESCACDTLNGELDPRTAPAAVGGDRHTAGAVAGDAFRPPRRSRMRGKLGAAGAALVALFAKLRRCLLLPKIKILSSAGTALVSGGRVQPAVGLVVRAGLRGAALHPRDGTRARAAPRGHPRQRGRCFHPVHGRRRRRPHRSATTRSPSPRRACRPGARYRSPRASSRSPATSRTPRSSRPLAMSGSCLNLFNLLPGRPPRRRPRDGGDVAVDVVPRLRRARRARLPDGRTRCC